MHENKVELMGVYGSDETHALSAWTSTSRALSQKKRQRIPQLLHMLMREGHHTPFEKSSLHFLVTTDIATHIHILKHRVGVSVNAESARYKELGKRERRGKVIGTDKYYVPDDWTLAEQDELRSWSAGAYDRYHEFVDKLVARGVPRKRAKESARYFLPYSTQITSDVMFNFRSFIHFQKLRNSEHAQKEVREVAQSMLQLVEETGLFPATLEAMKTYVIGENDGQG